MSVLCVSECLCVCIGGGGLFVCECVNAAAGRREHELCDSDLLAPKEINNNNNKGRA